MQNKAIQPRGWRRVARSKALRIGLGVFCAFAALYVLLILAIDRETRTPVRYLFPAGFVGKYRIVYEIKNAPPFPVEDDYLVVRFSKGGRIRTSSSPQVGRAYDEYYYVSPAGKWQKIPHLGEGSLVHGGGIGQAQTFLPSGKVITDPPYEDGFIGTEEQERKASGY